ANVLGLKSGGALALTGGGLAATAALAVAAEQLYRLSRAAPTPQESAAILTLTAFSLSFAAATAYGRIAFGFPGAQATRYVPPLVPARPRTAPRLQELPPPGLGGGLAAASALAIACATLPMRPSDARFMEHLS